jgi:Lar family restriction alleviation protein
MKLKPCPFCGTTEKRDVTGWRLEFFIRKQKDNSHTIDIDCGNCGITFGFGLFGNGIARKTAKEMVITQFNNRY